MASKVGTSVGSPHQLVVDDNNGAIRDVVSSGLVPDGVQFVGQITGTPAGAYRRGPSVYSPGGFIMLGHPSNTSFVGYSFISGSQSFPLNTNVSAYLPVDNLNKLYITAAVAGEVICWSMA